MNRRTAPRPSISWVLVLCAAAALAPSPAAQDGGRVARPRLVVVCGVDQLATWVLQDARPHLAADGGFARLSAGGVEFTGCAYAHACTETGPGHATIGTGAPARLHGIVKNEWFDRVAGAKVYCVQDPAAAALDGMPEGRDRSAHRLLVPTVGDLLKAHDPQSVVVSLSHKDRSAILMGGRRADAVVWIENGTGRFVTNTRWGERAPEWLLQLDAGEPQRRWFGWTWDRVGDAAAYAGLVDDRPFELRHMSTGQRTLPAVLNGGGRDEPGGRFHQEVYLSPVSNELVLEGALAAVAGAGLGADEHADLLMVSFSANDTVGHYFGPESVEARDTLLRLDGVLARLLAGLDDAVGAGRYAFVLTSDHGVAMSPEVAKAKGLGGGRELLHTRAKAVAEAALRAEFGDGSWITYVGGEMLYLDRERLGAWANAHGEAPEAVLDRAAALAAGACKDARGIDRGISVRELLATGPAPVGEGDDDPIRRAVFDGLVADRCGDVVFVPTPYWIEAGIAATHGSPHPYDREVPLLAVGPGLRRGALVADAVTPGLAAVLAARWLGIDRPAAATDDVPAAAFAQ
ncbi:MAG: alkaline phosphatase family protein [Planctomycetota bacterium]